MSNNNEPPSEINVGIISTHKVHCDILTTHVNLYVSIHNN